MTIQTITGWDATHENLPDAPHTGQPAGYTTGSAGIAWTQADWDAHPHAIRIDQDASAGDGTADVLDVENGAATPSECPGWVTRARQSIKDKKRPGQRDPVIYVNGSNITPVADALSHAGITGVGLWLADPGIPLSEAVAKVEAGSGPYPIIGVQYAWNAKYDQDVWKKDWVTPPPAAHKEWKEWVTAGDDSLAGLAAKLGVGITAMLEQTIKHYGYLDGATGVYVNSVFEGTTPPTQALPRAAGSGCSPKQACLLQENRND